MDRILIVEDERAIAKAMEKHIASWGYTVRCVEDFTAVLRVRYPRRSRCNLASGDMR